MVILTRKSKQQLQKSRDRYYSDAGVGTIALTVIGGSEALLRRESAAIIEFTY